MQSYARCTDDRRKYQLLADHLRGVASRCAGFAEHALPRDRRLVDVAEVTGLLHDLGKYREEFRLYLMAGSAGRRSPETAHAMYGAAAACFEFNLPLAAFAIAGHHAGLHDVSDLQQVLEGKKFQADRRYPELLRRAQQSDELGPLPAVDLIPFDESDDADKRRYEFFTRMLFSSKPCSAPAPAAPASCTTSPAASWSSTKCKRCRHTCWNPPWTCFANSTGVSA
jgi:CRISPR-associated endonuclease/helicase Cas3